MHPPTQDIQMPNASRHDMYLRVIKLRKRVLLSECASLYELLESLDNKPSWDLRVLDVQGTITLIEVRDDLRIRLSDTLRDLGVKLS